MFKIATIKNNKLLISSNELYCYMCNKNWLSPEKHTLTALNKIIEEVKLFSHIQTNLTDLIEHQNTNKETILSIKSNIIDSTLQLEFSKDELYNNRFNDILFKELKSVFGLKLHRY